jgi:hypothetical protein
MTTTFDGTSGAVEYMSDFTQSLALPRHRFHCGNVYLSAFVIAGDHVALRSGNHFYLRKANDYSDTDGDVRISSQSSGNASIEIRKSGSWTTVQTWS